MSNERDSLKQLSDLPVCVKCNHPDDTNEKGYCRTQMGSRNWAYCMCHCEFPDSVSPPTALPADQKLLPCPFCGRTPHGAYNNNRAWRVICECNAEGGCSLTEEGAIATWNTRTQPIQPAEQAVEGDER